MNVFPRLLPVVMTLILAAHSASAQRSDSTKERAPSVILMSRIKDGRVQIRWYPGSAGAWRRGNRHGYTVERMDLDGAADVAAFRPVQENQFKPLGKEEWTRRKDLQDEFAKAAADAIYTVTTLPQAKAGFDKMMAYTNEEAGVFYGFILGVKFSAEAAEAAGLSFEDKSARAGKDYAYRVYIADPENGNTDTAKTFISVTQGSTTAPAVTGIEVENGDGFVTVRWDYEESRSRFVSYDLERSGDGGKTFAPVNRLPIIYSVRGASTVSYTDSVVNYRRYLYRVNGITAFSDKGTPSVALPGMGRDLTPPSPATGTQAVGDLSNVAVTWNLDYTSPDLRGFVIARSAGSEGPFRLLTPEPTGKASRAYTDQTPNALEPYYIVYTVDTAGNYSNAFATLAQISDSVAPAAPLDLAGTVDSLGHVAITWKANAESDLAGYNLYVANAKDNVYRQINGAPYTVESINDTISMQDMNRSIYYKITALDLNNNPSPYSKILELKRPDVIPPASPAFDRYAVEDGKILLSWTASISDDVTAASLSRVCVDDGKAVDADVRTATSYTDAAVETGKTYTYTLTAADAAGHRTSSEPLTVKVYDNGIRKGITDLKAEWNKEENVAGLSWRYDVPGRTYYYLIYRGADAASLAPYRKVKAELQRATDADTPKGDAYYAVKVLFTDGGESELSPPVKLAVN